jgi:trehalose 6-phosphate synthase/phosphatase
LARLIIVSNRLPVKVTKRKSRLVFQSTIGGLATGLASFYKNQDGVWIGWPGLSAERLTKSGKAEVRSELAKEDCHPVFLTRNEIENYYYGFSNRTIWPLFHYFTQHTRYDNGLWRAYKRVNETFCSAVLEIANPKDTIWVHDYHLMLLPQLLREELPKAAIGFFLHIPFPSFEVFRLLPWREELLHGLLGADLIGFHTYDYVQHFLYSVRALMGYENSFGQINTEDYAVKTDAFPMGIDYQEFSEMRHNKAVERETKRIRKKVGDRKIILSADRLDYTKGIPQRLEAFDRFLEKNPEYKGKITLILLAVPSRTKVVQYRRLKQLLDELAGRINGKHGTIDWMPIWYLYRTLPFHALVALYRVADIALVTPLRDGMNLMAKEYVATKGDDPGVLILSEMAGASKELGEAIVVNPNNGREVAKALKTALTMPESEQIEHNRAMQNRIKRYNVERWAIDFMDSLADVKRGQREIRSRRLTNKPKEALLSDYGICRRRLILLDYDGTLVPFTGNPQEAKPDHELILLLERITDEAANKLIIISGRDKDTLEAWFGQLGIGLIAEHGVWIKENGQTWSSIERLRDDWKQEVRPILERYVDRTPGSFIEEKGFSLVWHYRKSDVALGSVRANELKNNLFNFTANLDLDLLEGNKVLEVMNSGVNKGRAASRWISKKDWDFILAAGDDWTDEDLFTALPDSAYSIKVGHGRSEARFHVDSLAEIRKLLHEMVSD